MACYFLFSEQSVDQLITRVVIQRVFEIIETSEDTEQFVPQALRFLRNACTTDVGCVVCGTRTNLITLLNLSETATDESKGHLAWIFALLFSHGECFH